MAEQIKFGDNLYLQGEKLVLDNGANAGVIKSNNGTVKIEGNLEVSGTTTTISSETVTFDDNILLLNSNETGTPSQDGGIEIERGTSTNKLLTWSESSDKWTVGAETFVAGTFEGPLTGNVTGNLSGNVTSTGTSAFTTVDINGGNIDNTIIGATTPAAGTFSTITGDGTAITNVLSNYTTTNLPEGTNKYFTDERVDDRIDALFTNAYGISGTYNDAGDVYTLAFDPINAGSAVAILDTTDTTQAKFRTIREGQVGSGGNGDLTVTLSGDEIVIDTTNKLNQLAYNTYTGNGSVSVYTLPYSVSQDWQALVYIDGVVQHPVTNYTISGTTLTLTSPLPNASKMNVIKMATNSIASPITNANTLGGNLPAHFLDWAQFTGTPTTIAGYGITDGYANSDVDAHLNQSNPTSGYVLSWNGSEYTWIDNSGYVDSDVDSHLNQSNPTSGYVLSWNGSDYAWIDNSGYTDSDFDTRLATKSTTNLSEGTNLYYTNLRSRAAISVSGDLSYNSSTGVISSTGLASSTTDDLSEGSTNLYYTDARADARADGRISVASTSDLSEGTNLYYTDARADTRADGRISSATTDDLSEGSTNLYYTSARVNTDFDTRLATKGTDDLTEGTNLYYTDARADARAQLKIDTLVDSAPGSLDTLNELAAALGDDANFSTTITNSIATKIGNVVEDTSPQLGGNLDLNTFDLTTTDPTVKLTTTLTATTAQGTVGASSETNTSTSAVTVNTDDSDTANAVSSYITLTSTQITSLGFEGDISLTYFGAAAPSSNFVWRDIGDSAEQNNMVIVYSPPADEYTFTLPTNVSLPTTPGNQTPFNEDDADIYFKQYAYGEMTVTSATALYGYSIQLRDSNGFFIDKDHVTVTSLGGTSYKIVFWTHDVGVGDVIDVIAASAQTALFEWGTSSFSETGLVATAESFSLTSSTNDIFAMGDLQITTGNITGEVVGTLIYDSPSNNTIISGLTTITIDGTGYQAATHTTDVPLIFTGNAGTSNELSLAVGSGTDARLRLMNSSGNLIYKFPAADGTTNQVMKTDGAGDLVWANDIDTNTTYTAGAGLTLTGTVFSNPDPDQTVTIGGTGLTTVTGTYPNFVIDTPTSHSDQTVTIGGTGATTISGTYPNFVIDSTNSVTDITGNIIPASDNTYDLGSTSKKYANIYSHSIHAHYADLAERYASDVPYDEGTVVVLGGDEEITVTSEAKDVSVAGVISINPGLKMNADAGDDTTHPYVALRGRVPCKMIGPVSKGDLIVTADNEPGYAQSVGKENAGRSVFAKSIETDLTEGKRLIEVVIL